MSPGASYAETAATPVSAMLVSPVTVEQVRPLREDLSELGAVGTATMYVAGLRDALVTSDVTLIRALALPTCLTCTAYADLFDRDAPLPPEYEVGVAVWVTGVDGASTGHATVTIGAESIATVVGADGTPTPMDRFRDLWTFELQHTPDGWAVRDLRAEDWI